MATSYITHVGSVVNPMGGNAVKFLNKKGVEKMLRDVFFFTLCDEEANCFELCYASAKHEGAIYQREQLPSHLKLRKLKEPILRIDDWVFLYQDEQGRLYSKHALGSKFRPLKKALFYP
jgi:hypothetical protein